MQLHRLFGISKIQACILQQSTPVHLQPAILEPCPQPEDQQSQKQPAQRGHGQRTH